MNSTGVIDDGNDDSLQFKSLMLLITPVIFLQPQVKVSAARKFSTSQL